MQKIACNLRQHLVHRHISEGLDLVKVARQQIDDATISESDQIEIFSEVINWIDFDFTLRDWAARVLQRWPQACRGRLLHSQALLLRFAEGAIFLHGEDFDNAAVCFLEVIHADNTLCDPHLKLLACYYAARAKYHQAQYPEADALAEEALSTGTPLMDGTLQTAGVKILKSRICLKNKPLKEAILTAGKLLQDAWMAFEPTDDRVSRGNVLTFLGEIAKRGPHTGKAALDLLNDAIGEFSLHPVSDLPGDARVRLRRARLRRDEALALMELVEQKFLRKNCAAAKVKIRELHDLALSDICRAKEIYDHLGHLRGLGNSESFEGYILLDRGNHQGAIEAAERAIEWGTKANCERVVTRGALLGAAVETSIYEAADSESDEELIDHATLARKYSKLAREHALNTEPRFIGRSYISEAKALLLGNPGADDRKTAESLRDAAKNIVRRFPGGSLQRDFDVLQRQLDPGGEAAAVLLSWIESRGGTSFANLEICITKLAWERTQPSIPQFMKLLELKCRHRAEGLLGRAGIFKMPKGSERHSTVALPENKGHHVG